MGELRIYRTVNFFCFGRIEETLWYKPSFAVYADKPPLIATHRVMLFDNFDFITAAYGDFHHIFRVVIVS